MGLQDKELLGRVVVPGDNDDSQVQINRDSLRKQNAQDIINKVTQRVSKYELDFLIGYIYNEPEFWNKVLKKLVGYYKLGSLRMFYSVQFGSLTAVELGKEVRTLLYYLKVDMQEMINDKKITLETTREELISIIKKYDKKTPMLLSWVLTYIDGESFRMFMKVLFKENSESYEE